MSWGQRAVIGVIRFYQLARVGRPSPCRYWPGCSAYAIEAVEQHGVVRGVALGARRLVRCRPGGASGIDLVPTREVDDAPAGTGLAAWSGWPVGRRVSLGAGKS